MANTVSQISYNNTFGDWVVATNSLIKENNDLAANNYTKPTGTLYLNEPTLGLQVSANAIVAGQLQVTGVGSSALIQNNLRVDRQVYFTNTTLGLVTSGQANVGGTLMALGSGTSLYSANNVNIDGATRMNSSVYITGNTNISNTIYISGTTNISNTLYIQGSESLTGSLVIGGSASAIGSVLANFVKGNTGVDTTTMTSSTLRNTGIAYTDTLQANTLITTLNLNVTGASYFDVITANTSFVGPKISITSLFDGNSAAAFFDTLKTNGNLTVGGNFVINGTTVYNSNNFVISSNVPNQNCTFGAYRTAQTGNSYIRWNENNKYWETNDVNTGTYYKIITDQFVNNTLTNDSSSNVATSFVANSIYSYAQAAFATANTTSSNLSANVSSINGTINSVNSAITIIQGVDNTQNTNITNLTTWLSSNVAYTQGVDNAQNNAITIIQGVDNTQNTVISNLTTWVGANVTYNQGINDSQNTNITAVNSFAQAAFNKANTASGALTFNGTTGSANANSSGYLVMTSGNGVTITGTAGTNTLTLNTPQDLRSSASPSFSTITSSVASGTPPLAVTSTSLVNNLNVQYLNGQAGSYYTNAGNLTGTIPTGVLGGSALYVGTTSIALNRSSGAQTLTGVNIDGSAGSAATVTGSTQSSITSVGTLTSLSVSGQTTSSKGYREGVVAVGGVSGATNLDLSQGNIFNITLNAAGIGFTFTNPPASGTACYITVLLTQGTGGSKTYGSFANSRWTDSVAPVLTTTAGKTDILMFFTVDGGANYYGTFTGANFG